MSYQKELQKAYEFIQSENSSHCLKHSKKKSLGEQQRSMSSDNISEIDVEMSFHDNTKTSGELSTVSMASPFLNNEHQKAFKNTNSTYHITQRIEDDPPGMPWCYAKYEV